MREHAALSSDSIGTELGPAALTLSPRRLMSFAAALDACEGVYMDDLRNRGILGLPPFVVVPEWSIMNGSDYREALGADEAAMWACIHVHQDSRFAMPLTPSMRIVTRGVISELRNTRIGLYVATRLTTTLVSSGALVAESWFCGIFLSRQLDFGDRLLQSAPVLPRLTFADQTNTTEPLLRITRALPHLYTEATSIWNPIHTERAAARASGLDDTLLHGTYTWAAAGLHLIRRCADGDPQRLRRLAGRMAGKASIGRDLAIQFRDAGSQGGSSEVTFQVIDDAGVVVIADGVAEFNVHPR